MKLMIDKDCIFCKLANGEIPTEIVYENESVTCFKDANPQTETHLLLLTKNHYANALELFSQSEEDSLAIIKAIPEIASKLNLEEQGLRIINNCGEKAGQSVFHVHFHIMSDADKLRERLV